jgi:ribosomal protein L29
MAVKKTKKAPAKAKKVAAKKAAPKAKKTEQAIETKDLDRKALAAHVRQAKKELLAIRFNLQAPSLKEYRRKKAEVQKFLSQLN